MNPTTWFRTRLSLLTTSVGASGWYSSVDFLSKVAVLIGIGFTVFQLVSFERSERIKYTFQFVERFDGDNFQSARKQISSSLKQYEDRITQLNAIKISPDAEAKMRERIASFLVNDSNEGRGIAMEIDLLVRFFNALEICIEKKICDRGVAAAFLGSHAGAIWTNFGPYIVSRRGVVRDYGVGMELFVVNARKNSGG